MEFMRSMASLVIWIDGYSLFGMAVITCRKFSELQVGESKVVVCLFKLCSQYLSLFLEARIALRSSLCLNIIYALVEVFLFYLFQKLFGILIRWMDAE